MAPFIGGLKVVTKLRQLCNYHVYQSLPLSVEAAVTVDHKLPRFRTLENDPFCHTEEHMGKFYSMDPDVRKKLFLSGGLAKELELQIKTFRESCFMVRKPSLELISYLKNLNYSLPAVRFVVYGKLGVGKTCTLAHLVHFGYRSKYLLLHVPWASSWTKTPKKIAISQSHPDRVDLPLESALWLQHFMSQNSELLKELNLLTSQSYTWSKREVTEEGQPITEIVQHGIERMQHASDCVAVLLKEIKHHSKFGKFKALVIIDGVNAFYTKTNIKLAPKTMANADDVTIVRAFQKLLRTDWTNAAIIATVDGLVGGKGVTIEPPHTPLALLGKKGFEVLDPFIPVLVENYTNKEIESNLDYYIDRLWIQNEDAWTEEGRAQLKFLSGFNPYRIMKLCNPL